MILSELFGLGQTRTSTQGTNGTQAPKKSQTPKTAQELNAERLEKRKQEQQKRTDAMKARATKNGQRKGEKPETSEDEVINNN